MSNAQLILGSEYLRGGRFLKNESLGYKWLRLAANGGPSAAQVYLALRLATEDEPELNNVDEAAKFLAMVDEKEYVDKISYYEAAAAIAIAQGRADAAKKYREKLLKEAREYNLENKVSLGFLQQAKHSAPPTAI